MSRLTPEQVRRRLDRGLVPAVPVPFTATTEIDLEAQWTDPQGRPQSIVTEGGRPIPEMTR